MDSNTIGSRIKALREHKEMTQAEVAEALHVKRQTVDQWENGTRDLKTQYTIDLADFFGVSCDEILRGIKAENLSINQKIGLSDRSIEILETQFKPERYLVAAIDYLLGSRHLDFFCRDIIKSVSDELNYQKNYQKKMKQYKELDCHKISELPEEIAETLSLLDDFEKSGLDNLHLIRKNNLVKKLHVMAQKTYDYIFTLYQEEQIATETVDNGKSS